MRRVLVVLIIALIVGIFIQNPVKALLHSGQLTLQTEVEINDGPPGDLSYFADENKTMEKGRLIRYRVTVRNNANQVFKNLTVKMELPRYVNYWPETTFTQNPTQAIPDVNGKGALQAGMVIASLPPGQQWQATWQGQVQLDLPDERLPTLAWATAYDDYTALPLLSNTVQNAIEGVATPILLVTVEPSPASGTPVRAGEIINYRYHIENVGGLPAEAVRLIPAVPPGTQCQSGCQSQLLPLLETGIPYETSMTVQVSDIDPANPVIIHQPVQMEWNGGTNIYNPDITHPVTDAFFDDPDNELRVDMIQSPNTVLNSPNATPRADDADQTETQFTIHYDGTGVGPVLANIQNQFGANPYPRASSASCMEYYAYPPFTEFYTYNSAGPPLVDCQGPNPQDATRPECRLQLSHQPLAFTIQVQLPQNGPRLEWVNGAPPTLNEHEMTLTQLNQYMASGSTLSVVPANPDDYLSRATENGALGIVSATVSLSATQTRWRFEPDGTASRTCRVPTSGGGTRSLEVPRYRWRLVGGPDIITARDDQIQTPITVYTSTAWLKTEGGHIATNGAFTNNQNPSNQVQLGTAGLPVYTDSATYTPYQRTPEGEFNAEYMIFGREGTGSMISKSGDLWKQEGTEFTLDDRGPAYERTQNARDFRTDLIDKQLYGPVQTDQLPALITGTVDLDDGMIWHQTGDLTIGRLGSVEPVVFAGGQSRIYVDGTVTINANIQYATSSADHYNDITAVRIDAQNIIINGDVESIESFLLARQQFSSGISKNPLHILGDVIAESVQWQRQPLEQINPETFNDPSEHIIEDPRKYIIPPPGDTALPNQHNTWRQE